MHLTVIIPAAGRSQRFRGGDKLNQDLGGRPLLLRTVEVFTKRDEVKSIIVAGPPEDFDQFRERFGGSLSFHGAILVKGGATERWETVKNALAAVPDDATHIAVHDAARPAPGKEMLDRLLEASRTLDAVIPVVQVTATLKRVSAEAQSIEPDEDAVADAILGDAGRVNVQARRVEQTVDRRGLYEVQTPQVFKADLLRRAYAQSDLAGVTDDASLVERLGEPVYAVEGDVTNIKVTTEGDLRLVRAILGVKAPAERPAHMRF
jgi:2-C-methyl-D-erythritol 4-phosphate cytidylyltransferase